MPTINKRFLLQLVLVVVVLTGALYGIHSIQAERIPDALHRQAERAQTNGQIDKAIQYLRQYLEFRPDDTERQDELAELLRTRSGDAARADLIFLYDKILRKDPFRHGTRREALKLCLRIGRYTDAVTHADLLLKEFPKESELWQQLASAQAALRQHDAAVASYEKAIENDPQNLLGYQRLAQFHWRDLKNPDAARQVIDRMVQAMPENSEAFLTRAKYISLNQDSLPAKADQDVVLADLSTALNLAPHLSEAAIMKAERLQRYRDLHGAYLCLVEARKHQPADPQLIRSLAWLEVNRGNVGGAIAVLEEGLTTAKDGVDLLVPLADMLLQFGETARTQEIIRKLDSRTGTVVKLQSLYLRSRLAMQEQQWEQAISLLTQLRSDSMRLPGLESQANLLMAACFHQTGEWDRELEALKLIVSKDPNHLAARMQLGQVYLNAGQFIEAQREYELAVQSPFAVGPVCTLLVRMKAARLIASGAPASAWNDLERQVRELAPRYGPSAVEPVLLLADLAQMAGKPDHAVKLLQEETTRRPGDVRLWVAYAEAMADRSGVAAGLGVLDEAMSACGDGVEMRLCRARLYVRDPARLRPLDALEAHTDSWPDADQTRLLSGLVDIFDRVADDQSVIRLYRRLASRRSGEVATWVALFKRALVAGDQEATAMARRAITRLDGEDGPMVTIARAWEAIQADTPERMAESRKQLIAAFGETPRRADACLLLAELASRLEDTATADRLYLHALQLDPGRFEPTRMYLTYLVRSQQDAALTRHLTRLSLDPRWYDEALRRVVFQTCSRIEKDQAVRLLRSTRRIVEPYPTGLAWLARCMHDFGQTEEALTIAQAGIKRPRATMDDWLQCIVLQPEDHVDLLNEAKETLSGRDLASLAAAAAELPQAQAWQPRDPSGEYEKAFLQSRLAIKLARMERTEAIALLEQYLARSNIQGTDWAKRNLAMLLVIQGEPDDRQRALKILSRESQKDLTKPEDQRSTAAVLTTIARYLDGEDRSEVLDRAITLMKRLVEDGQHSKDGYLLTQLYRMAHRHREARLLLNKLLAADPGNLDYLLAGLDILLESNEMTDAVGFAKRLLEMYPAEFRVVAAVARFECRAGRPEKAYDLIETYTRTADGVGTELTAKLIKAAELLDELSRQPGNQNTAIRRKMVDAAITKYDMALAGRAESIIAIAGLLASDDRIDEAFQRIEKASRTLTDRSRAAAGLAALRSGNGKDPHFRQVQGWLEASRNDEPDSIALQLTEAEYLTLKHDYSAAGKVYEQILKQDPRNVVALNNLAWILSPKPEAQEQCMELITRAIRETGFTAELLDTRARVWIAAQQITPAEDDLREALRGGKTPLRLFHFALAKHQQQPPRLEEARKAFQEAQERGLTPAKVHPEDLPVYRELGGQAPPNS